MLLAEFDRLLAGQHDLLAGLSHVKRAQVLALLNAFDAARPDSFAFAGASIGNLVMAGSYVTEGQQIGPALRATARLIGVQGTVRPIVDGAFGLGADLADGSRVAGQRDLTGKEVAPPAAPIRRLFLTDHGQELPPKAVPLPPGNRALIQSADLICYAPGSFFTSVLANLLPQGVGQAIAARDVPKLYLPSLGDDPEARGMRLPDRIDRLLQMLRADAGPDCLDDQLVSLILCDADAVSAAEAAACAVPVRRLPLRNPARPERYAPSAVCEALLSLM